MVLGLLLTGWVVALGALFPDEFARALTGRAGMACWGPGVRWAEWRAVLPARCGPGMTTAGIAGFALYLVVVGTLVRRRFEDSAARWTLGAS